MEGLGDVPAGFDPEFDDTSWTDEWLRVPIALPPAARHPSGYRLERRLLGDVEIFGRPYRLPAPFDCRILLDPEGRLWMSNTPQEHIMMFNNARLTRGRVLVGGLGLGLYPQYAQVGVVGAATSFTVVEQSRVVADLVAPTVRAALTTPVEVVVGDVEEILAGGTIGAYDTVFLDTWATLDAAGLPAINRLRDLAARRLAPGGRVLLWGYGWMVRLFEHACGELIAQPPEAREAWLADRDLVSAEAAELLAPVHERFAGKAILDGSEALAWCRRYAVTM